LINSLTFYALFATPFVLVFKEASDALRNFEMFVDICFTMDIIFNFLKLGPNQKESDFKDIRIAYIRSYFVFDCVAALPGLIT